MPGELRGGVRMALRRWPTMLSLAAMIGLACVVLVVLLADVLVRFKALRGGHELCERGAVVFKPYYGISEVTSVPDRTVADLVDMIRAERAYTAVINNARLDDPDFAGGVPTVLFVGSELAETVPDLELCEPAPCAMRGAEVAPPAEPVEVAGHTFTTFERLPRAATHFEPRLGAVPLNERLVLNLPPRALPRLDRYEREEAVSRAALLDVSDSELDGYLAGSAAGELYLVPHRIAVDQPKRLSGLMVASTMYVAGLAAFLALVLLAFAATARRTLHRERAVFAIRRTHGASSGHIAVRIAGFVGIVVLVPPLPPLAGLLLVGGPLASAAGWLAVLVVVIFVGLWGWTVKQQRGHELKGR
ncbi:hypothetical protein CDG81_03975 [Actinopolyspora erythraea]|uniref:ABC transporter permease n=1 Tax=Actinopolyspora erythraea TaxID=414996 RepID=A0A099D3G6_9ACTN|nr:hypothetical protein [Actinopolyspora erythraea]ASU77609.1 hypothetical protein CDG81_03975 [Actinopolyspora erythraea]KGI80554.1 hypothetical protein IL38_16970 [Actinopolyspora erythraea]